MFNVQICFSTDEDIRKIHFTINEEIQGIEDRSVRAVLKGDYAIGCIRRLHGGEDIWFGNMLMRLSRWMCQVI